MIDFIPQDLIYAVMSRSLLKDGPSKITCRPLQIKGKPCFQFTIEQGGKAFHQNCGSSSVKTLFCKLLESFKEVHLFTKEADLHFIRTQADDWKALKTKPSKKALPLAHNRQKEYLLNAGSHPVFWQALGIANGAGAIKPDKQAKFRQVNRYIELLDDVLASFPEDKPLTIIDFGCGKAYLTFALYHYLVDILKRPVAMIGIDLKQDVVDKLENIRKSLGYNKLSFYAGDIRTYPLPPLVDLVISLHACDTATDAVLSRAIESKARAIVAVPCCQHAFYGKIDHPDLKPLLKHGILKERFAALATDAARAALLESQGYTTQVVEFIDTEHTPKNLMIRAIKSSQALKPSLAEEYRTFLNSLHLS
jgi:SAM-dependent methyltransferase